MSQKVNTPEKAPDYSIHREAVAAPDVIANVVRAHGINMSGYDEAHIQVVPSGGANPNVAVYWWSENAGVFVQEHTAIAKSGVGVNTPYEFTVKSKGRIMFVAVATIAAGVCDVLVSGFNREFPG